MAKKAYVWDGSSWISISSAIPEVNTILPSQNGNSGKFLTTNGSVVSWGTVDLTPYATKASPTFTGTPVAPTAAVDTNTTQIATTAFVNAEISNDAVLQTGGSTITVTSGTTVPLTIQNNGTGNSFVVNDVASDTNPFIIDATGNVLIGTTQTPSNLDTVTPKFILSGSGVLGSAQIIRNSTPGGGGGILTLSSNRGADVSSHSSLQSGDGIGSIIFSGSDGGEYVVGARIVAQVDGTPGDNDMPTRITFNTTPDGSASPLERMRIDASGRIQIPAGGILEAPISTNAQAASYTLVLTDAGRLIEMNVSTANNLTVPLNSSVAFPIGTKIDILQTGAGQTTIVATGGVTINSTPGLKLSAQWAAASLIKRGTDTWVLIGNLSA